MTCVQYKVRKTVVFAAKYQL